MAVLVTGATGFIGRHVVDILVGRGEAVHILCRKQASSQQSIPRPWPQQGRVTAFSGDILDTRSLLAAMEECDRVYHLAAYARQWARNPKVFLDVNVGGVRNVLTAAIRSSIRRVVVTSSSVTFGPSRGYPQDESMPRVCPPLTMYEFSKCEAEREATRFIEDGLEVVIVNPTRMFGPGLLNEGNSVTRMVKWYAEGKWHFILGDGHAIGNYGFVSDVAKGHVQAMESGQSGERYLLGGENLSYNQFFEMLADLSQRRSMLIHVPSEVALAAGKLEESRGKWSRHQPTITRGWVQTFLHDWEFSSSKAERELGYRITPFREALSTTLQWIALQVSLNIHKEEKCSCVPPSPLLAQ